MDAEHAVGGPADSSVSGLVITVAEGATCAVMDALAHDLRFTLGERFGRSLAAVLEAPTDDEAEAAFRWLADLPGVARADVVFVRLAGR